MNDQSPGVDFKDKIESFVSAHANFKSDDGSVIEYDYFVVTARVNGEPYVFNVKTKGFADKVAILNLADDVDA
jgi:hypothetical protein